MPLFKKNVLYFVEVYKLRPRSFCCKNVFIKSLDII